MDLGAALTDLIRAYCREEGIAWKDEGAPFVKQLQREAMLNMDDPIAERGFLKKDLGACRWHTPTGRCRSEGT